MHHDFANSVKLFQSLFDRLRSSHSYRAALALAETVYVDADGLQRFASCRTLLGRLRGPFGGDEQQCQ